MGVGLARTGLFAVTLLAGVGYAWTCATRTPDVSGRLDLSISSRHVRYQDEATSRFLKGSALLGKKDFDGAIVEFRAAIKLKPADHLSHNNLGYALACKGDL